jgi:hypothetical protein
MKLLVYDVEDVRCVIEPAGTTRQWMQETPDSFAYRCLPLTSANAHGWDLLTPASFEAVWNGGSSPSDVEIRFDTEPQPPNDPGYLASLLNIDVTRGEVARESESMPSGFVEAHFGSGILTFNPLLIVRTEESCKLWICGPANHFKDAIQPMTALVDSDWLPFTFSMNWKFTRPDTPIRFESGEPFCTLFPVTAGLVDACQPVRRPLSDNKELRASYWNWRSDRGMVKDSADPRSRFLGYYARGGKGDKRQHDGARGTPRPRVFKHGASDHEGSGEGQDG